VFCKPHHFIVTKKLVDVIGNDLTYRKLGAVLTIKVNFAKKVLEDWL